MHSLEDLLLNQTPLAQSTWVTHHEFTTALCLSTVNENRNLLIILSDKQKARNLVDNLNFFLKNKKQVFYIPDIDIDPQKNILGDLNKILDKSRALYQSLCFSSQIFVTTHQAALQKCTDVLAYKNALIKLNQKKEFSREELLKKLRHIGYQHQPIATDPGTYSFKGAVVDVFSSNHNHPVRIEYFGDEIESLRFFDPKTQRSARSVDEVTLIPSSFSFLENFSDEVENKIKTHFDSIGMPKSKREEILAQMQEGHSSHPFLFPILHTSSSLWDYFKDAVIWMEKDSIDTWVKDAYLHFENAYHHAQKENIPMAAFNELFCDPQEYIKYFERSHFYLSAFDDGAENNAYFASENISLKETLQHKSFEPLAKRLKNYLNEGTKIHIVFKTATHAHKFQSLLEPYQIRIGALNSLPPTLSELILAEHYQIHLWQGWISESCFFPKLNLLILSEEEVFGKKKRVSQITTSYDQEQIINQFKTLKEGDYVVHKDHGIGRYLGLKSREFLGTPNEYVCLEYKDGDKLYVPIYHLNVIQKYVGAEAKSVLLDKLGTDKWQKTKQKAKQAAQELAAQLLDIQAKRKLVHSEPCPTLKEDYFQFELEFPFEETPDQQKAIDDVMHDLERNYPMDRLLIGDVGYGKTEIAMRAAYRVAMNGRQVAILCPTTLLAFQHLESFKRRFKNTPVTIDMVSRLRTDSQNKNVLKSVSEGKVDIIIGTHRLLSSDFSIKNLGLLIVDEEHRFGVLHKEKLKKYTSQVHVLTLTATPIPRTLNMALVGIKDMSMIATPPPDRLSVRTFVSKHTSEMIQEAIHNEISRGGQIFFVHNRIQGIYSVADELRKLFPNLNMTITHGQMESDELEKHMLKFYAGEIQILITTAIIESGIDIPKANTIIIDDAHTLGLAQLYQLRGRVGRSDKRAYCYLLIPSENLLTSDAKQRLQVIQRYSELGSGFSVASHDLEIRGAGDFLGKEQSGHLNAVGVDLYFELLEESVLYLKGQSKKIEVEPDINMKISAYFPHDYIPDVSERVVLYRRLSSSDSEERISDIESEMIDRFGPLPLEVINMLGMMRIRLVLKTLYVTQLSCGPKRLSLKFSSETQISPQTLVDVIKKNPSYAFSPDQKLLIPCEHQSWQNVLNLTQKIAHDLSFMINS